MDGWIRRAFDFEMTKITF